MCRFNPGVPVAIQMKAIFMFRVLLFIMLCTVFPTFSLVLLLAHFSLVRKLVISALLPGITGLVTLENSITL